MNHSFGMFRILIIFMLLGFQFALASDLSEKLMDDYKIKKKSALKICQQKPYRYVRFYKTVDDDGHRVDETYSMKVSPLRKEADHFNREEDVNGLPPYPTEVKDINGDGLRDILVSYGGCGSRSDCMYDVLVYCGQGKYKSLINEEGNSLNSPRFSSKTTLVDGVAWSQIESISRYSNDSSVGCDEARGDFAVTTFMRFNGNKFDRSKTEKKRIAKEFKKEFARIEKVCGKKFKF